MNKQKDDLGGFLEPIKQVWRTRELSFQFNGKRIDKIGKFYLDNSVPGAVLNVIDALGLETKAGLKPVICHKHQEPYGWHIILQLPPGISGKDIESKIHYFSEQAGGSIDLRFKGGKVYMDISTNPLPGGVAYTFEASAHEALAMPVPIGMTVNGSLVIDLSELPHMLVAGVPGGGKSNFLHVMANSLLQGGGWIVIIDLKRLEFSYLKERALVAYNLNMAYEVLVALNKELDKRLEKLELAECVKIQDYKGADIPYIAVVIDEFSRETKYVGY